MEWESIFIIIITILMLILLYTELFNPEICLTLMLVIVWNAKILTIDEALSGYSNSGMITVGALFIAVKGVEKSRIVDRLARYVFGDNTSKSAGLFRMQTIAFILSGFFNNTPLVALFLPIVKDWARSRGFAPSQFLMPLSYCTVAGGVVTIIGTSTNLVIQGLLKDDGYEQFGFFEMARFGIPLGFILIVYNTFIGPKILPENRGGMFRFVRDRANEMLTEIEVQPNCLLIGKSVDSVLQKIGFNRDILIKIRRQCSPVDHPIKISEFEGTNNSVKDTELPDDDDDDDDDDDNRERIPSIEDEEYVKSKTKFWFAPGNVRGPTRQTDFVGDQPVDGSKDTSGIINDSKVVAHTNRDNTQPEMSSLLNRDDDLGDSKFFTDGSNIFVGVADNRVTFKTENNDKIADDKLNPSIEMPNVEKSKKKINFRRIISIQNPHHAHPIQYCDILPVAPGEILHAGDILFLSIGSKGHLSLHENLKQSGLKLLDVNVLDLPGFGSDVIELVLSDSNPFIGQCIGNTNFAQHYECSILAVRSRGEENIQDPTDTRLIELKPGDIVLIVAKEEIWKEKLLGSKDFFVVSSVGSVPPPVRYWDYIPVLFFCVFVGLIASDTVETTQAAVACAMLNILGGWVSHREAVRVINWELMLLIGSALGYAKSIKASGLSGYISDGLKNTNISPHGSLFLILLVTIVITELVTNNAAAALCYPIGVGVAEALNISYKPFAMAVMIGASSGYALPIGYQTHVMVWGPGGYTFGDFIKLGLILDLMYLGLGTLLIPLFWPF